MVKIHILGGSGSGKTTLASKIATALRIPHYEFDHLGIKDALAVIKQPEWVTEAIHMIWIDPLLDQADYIVLLEISWPLAAWRIISRHIKKNIHGTNLYPGFGQLFRFLRNTRTYYLSVDTATAEFVQKDLEEHKIHKGTVDPDILQMHLEKYMSALPLTAELTRLYLEQYKEKLIVVRNRVDKESLLRMLKLHQLRNMTDRDILSKTNE